MYRPRPRADKLTVTVLSAIDDDEKEGPPVRFALAVVLTAGLVLAGCSSPDEETGPGESLEVNEPVAPGADFEAQDVNTRTVDSSEFAQPVLDEGLNVEYHFQGTSWGPYGGTAVTVAVTNLNDEALPPEALGEPELRYDDGTGSTTASLLETTVPEGSPPAQVPLDLPLGTGATTNLRFTYDVSRSSLYDAEFEIGNIIYEGNLVN